MSEATSAGEVESVSLSSTASGFGVSMVTDPRGSTLLDVLGDDRDERGAQALA